MKVLKQGHVYELKYLDCGNSINPHERLMFVNRNHGEDSPGTTNQEVIRVLINRVEFLDKEHHWPGNIKILKHLRMALVLHESRHLERLVERGLLLPESLPVGVDGHYLLKEIV